MSFCVITKYRSFFQKTKNIYAKQIVVNSLVISILSSRLKCKVTTLNKFFKIFNRKFRRNTTAKFVFSGSYITDMQILICQKIQISRYVIECHCTCAKLILKIVKIYYTLKIFITMNNEI